MSGPSINGNGYHQNGNGKVPDGAVSQAAFRPNIEENQMDRGHETLRWLLGLSDRDYAIEFNNRSKAARALRIIKFLSPPDRGGRGLFASTVDGKPLGRLWSVGEIADACEITLAEAAYHVYIDPDISECWKIMRQLLVGAVRDRVLSAALGGEITKIELSAANSYLSKYDAEARSRTDVDANVTGNVAVVHTVVMADPLDRLMEEAADGGAPN